MYIYIYIYTYIHIERERERVKDRDSTSTLAEVRVRHLAQCCAHNGFAAIHQDLSPTKSIQGLSILGGPHFFVEQVHRLQTRT